MHILLLDGHTRLLKYVAYVRKIDDADDGDNEFLCGMTVRRKSVNSCFQMRPLTEVPPIGTP